MRVVIQRVTEAKVVVDAKTTGEIGPGMVILVGVGREDSESVPAAIAAKIANLRIFNDGERKMNLSLLDTGGAVLAIPQFTLYGDTHGQRRPSFIGAASPEQGKAGYDAFVGAMRALGVHVETGIFQAHMSVQLTNDGPVTILIDSSKAF